MSRVFTPGHHGGFLDCLALRPNSHLMVIDWKTDQVTAADAVRLAAYTCAERRLVTEDLIVEGSGPSGHNIYWGAQLPDEPFPDLAGLGHANSLAAAVTRSGSPAMTHPPRNSMK